MNAETTSLRKHLAADRAHSLELARALLERFPPETFDDLEFTEGALRDVFANTLGRERALLVAAARVVAPTRFARGESPDDPATLAAIDANADDARWACATWRAAFGGRAAPKGDAPKPNPLLRVGAFAAALALLVAFGPQVAKLVAPTPSASDATAAPTPSAAATIDTSLATPPTAYASAPAVAGTARQTCLDTWRSGQWKAAKSACDTAALFLPDDPVVQLGLGEAELAIGEPSAAKLPLESAVRLETSDIESPAVRRDREATRIAFENRGYAYYELGILTKSASDFQRAKDDFRETRRDGTTSATVLYYFADSAYHLEAWCDAQQAFEQLLRAPSGLDAGLTSEATNKLKAAKAQCAA